MRFGRNDRQLDVAGPVRPGVNCVGGTSMIALVICSRRGSIGCIGLDIHPQSAALGDHRATRVESEFDFDDFFICQRRIIGFGMGVDWPVLRRPGVIDLAMRNLEQAVPTGAAKSGCAGWMGAS